MVPMQCSSALGGLHQNLAFELPQIWATLQLTGKIGSFKAKAGTEPVCQHRSLRLITAQPSEAVDMWRMNDSQIPKPLLYSEPKRRQAKKTENRKALRFLRCSQSSRLVGRGTAEAVRAFPHAAVRDCGSF